MTSRTLLQEVSRFAAGVRDGDVDPEVLRDARRRVTDIIGIALAASAMEPAAIVGAVIEGWGGEERAGIIGRSGKYPTASAALMNGTLAHSLDYDDTHLPSVLHPSAAVVPAVLAAAEASGATGRDLLCAVAAGDELVVRVGMAGYDPELGNSIFFEKGLHATSIAGTLGAALAAAMVYGLAEEELGHAVAISASMGAGIIEANRTGGTIKRVHCGWAAHAGVAAADLARHGLTGPPTVLEGRFGFLQAFCGDRTHVERVTDGLGERWETPGIFFKPYPCNHFTHAGIDAALAIRRKHAIDPRRIRRIELGSGAAALRTIGEPREEKVRPRSGYHAQFSGPFTVATALLGGGGLGVYFDDFTDAKARDPALLDLAARVETFVDEACDRAFPHQFPAVLRVELEDGTRYEERVMQNRGGPGNPLSDDELRQKFALNATRAITRAQAERLAETIFTLDRSADVGQLLALTQPE